MQKLITYAVLELRLDGWHLIHASREKQMKYGTRSQAYPLHIPEAVTKEIRARKRT